MDYIHNLSGVFQNNEISWGGVIRLSIAVPWMDWREKGERSQEIIKKINAIQDNIIQTAESSNFSVETITKQAVVKSDKTALPLARIVVNKLLFEKKLPGDENKWDLIFPPITPLEQFLIKFANGGFESNPSAFAELLAHAINSAHVGNCIQNFVHSHVDGQISCTDLLRVLSSNDAFANIKPGELFDTIEILQSNSSFICDLTKKDIESLPVGWRSELLSRVDLLDVIGDISLVAEIQSDPHSFSYTPEWRADEDLYKLTSEKLSKGIINIEQTIHLVKQKGVVKRYNEQFDWKFLEKLSAPIKLENFDKSKFYILIEQLESSEGNEFFNNIVTLIVSGLEDVQYLKASAAKSLDQFISEADTVIKFAAIRLSSAAIQERLLTVILGKDPSLTTQQLCANAFFKSSNEAEITSGALLLLVPFLGKQHKKWAYEIADKYSHLGAGLLKDPGYYEHTKKLLDKRKIGPNVISHDYMSSYNQMGSLGVEVLEKILTVNNRIVGCPSGKTILKKICLFCPSLVFSIFSKRGISNDNFLSLLENELFRKLTDDEQSKILSLKNAKGRSSLRECIKSNLISNDILRWIYAQGHLRNDLIIVDPYVGQSHKPSPSELLASCCMRPSKASEILSGIDQNELIMALPSAIELLKKKPRIAAALELSLRSDISNLPVMMRLAHRLSTPYSKDMCGRRFDDLYVTYELPKKSGGKRIISAPAAHLKGVQRSLLGLLYAEGYSAQAMGFVPGRSIKTNAEQHTGKQIVVNADIRSFFPSTSYTQVYRLSRKLCGGGLSPLAARLFSEICCFNGSLATGAPTSPAVTNLIMRSFDSVLSRISIKLDVSYTRYADDITFSGESAAIWMLKPLKSQLAHLGYELDPKKTNIFRKGRRQTVTGVVVNQKPNIARPLRKRLRAAVERRIKGGKPFLHDKELNDASLNGYINYLRMISPEKADVLIKKLRTCPQWIY